MNTASAERYGWVNNADTYSHSYLLPQVAALVNQAGGGRVLDIGTGNGSALPFWKRQGWTVSAMEPDREGYEHARIVEGVEEVLHQGVEVRLPDRWTSTFDAVVSLEVVEHLFNPSLLVTTASQALRPGGVAVISTPYHGYWKNLALALANKWDFHHHPERVGGHIKFWSRDTLRSLFVAQGFLPRSFHGAGRLPWLWKSMIWVFQKPS